MMLRACARRPLAMGAATTAAALRPSSSQVSETVGVWGGWAPHHHSSSLLLPLLLLSDPPDRLSGPRVSALPKGQSIDQSIGAGGRLSWTTPTPVSPRYRTTNKQPHPHPQKQIVVPRAVMSSAAGGKEAYSERQARTGAWAMPLWIFLGGREGSCDAAASHTQGTAGVGGLKSTQSVPTITMTNNNP